MLPEFEFYLPETLDEAFNVKRQYGQDAEYVAGGTDVYAKMHTEGHSYPHIIDLKKIPELQGIVEMENREISMGSMVTHHEIWASPVMKKNYFILTEGVFTIGSHQVRNRGTIGGNICTAAPSADGIGPLLVLNARAVVKGSSGERVIPLEKFFTGPKKTVLEGDEVLARIMIPPVSERSGGAYFKYGRRNAMEIALQAISVFLQVEEDGKTCSDVRIALGTSAPTPIRAYGTEEYLKGKDLTNDTLIAETGRVILNEARPRSSWRSSAEFRKDLLVKLVPRTIRKAYSRIDQGEV